MTAVVGDMIDCGRTNAVFKGQSNIAAGARDTR